MKRETGGKMKYGVWGIIIGAVVAIILGFAWGGWTTAGTTQKITEEAVVSSQAAICVAQFMKEPDYKEKLKMLEELDSWKRADFIKKGGWDKMPGQENADYSVSQACASGLERLFEK